MGAEGHIIYTATADIKSPDAYIPGEDVEVKHNGQWVPATVDGTAVSHSNTMLAVILEWMGKMINVIVNPRKVRSK
jgi:hypothetical protein